jgi:hypothetical protein
MKKIIIIGCYPSTNNSEKMLSDCIDILSNTDYDLMVVSHYPIPTYIQEKVNYTLYDNENILLPYDLTPKVTCFTTDFDTVINNNGHSLTVSKNINNGINFCNNLGYEFFYFIESDNLFGDKDLSKLETLRKKMFEQNKKMIFFHQCAEEYLIYETLIFGGVPNYYLENIKLPSSINQLIDTVVNPGQSLERILYDKINNQNFNFLIINQESSSFFNDSGINIIAHDYSVNVIGNNIDNRLILWLNNLSSEKTIHFTINDNHHLPLTAKSWYYQYVNDNEIINIEINDNGYITQKQFIITEENKNEYRQKGSLNYKIQQ